MAWTEHTWLGYINDANIVTVTPSTSRVRKENTTDVTDWYFKVLTNNGSFESPKYATESEANTARTQLKSDLGV